MSSKELTKNIKKPAGYTGANWEKEDRLSAKYLRESEYIKQKQSQKK